jgi:ABC-2 family transporter protein
MMWLTWRQFRIQAIVTAAGLVLVAIALAVTGIQLADKFNASGIVGCHAGSCGRFAGDFLTTLRGSSYQVMFLIAAGLIYAIPALIGVFWGAPLITREIEAGTLGLAWTQSVTRKRWLVVKIGLIGLVAVATAGVLSFLVGWWAHPVYEASLKAAVRGPTGINRFPPALFGISGIAPIGYAAFGFALGLAFGVLIRRTLPAMAATLGVFAGIQVAWPQLIRPHLLTPLRATMPVTASNIDSLMLSGTPNQRPTMAVTAAFNKPGAWILSKQAYNAAGKPFTGPAPEACQKGGMQSCNAAVGRLNLHQIVTYQPGSRYWAFQWYETAIFVALALLLAWFCYWRVSRRRLS